MTHPTANNLYPIANGTTSSSPFIEVFAARNPGPNDNNYQIQKRWWNTSSNVEYVLVGFTSTGGELQAIWEPVSTGSIVPVETLTGDTGGPIDPIGNNINLLGDGVITTAGDNVSATIVFGLTGIVEPAHGGTGVASPPAHTLPVAEGAAPFTFLGPLMSGELLIGSTGADPIPNTLTAGTGITIMNGAGTIMISSTAAGFIWNLQAANLANLVKNNGYLCVAPGGALTLGLPTFGTSILGDTFEVVLNGATSFQITQNANQLIRLGSQVTTAGVGGSLTSTAQGDLVEIVYQSNVGGVEQFVVINSQGNLTIV